MAADAKLYYLPKSFLIRLINELTEDELNELARDTAKNDLVDVNLFLKGGIYNCVHVRYCRNLAKNITNAL
jgi:hypothetical protein